MAKQIGDWPTARAVERTIPQIRFAPGSEPVKLPVGLRNIIATESADLKAEVDTCSITYAYWYWSDQTLENVASELKLPLKAICTSHCLGWSIDVLAAEFALTNVQADRNDRGNDHWRGASARASCRTNQVCSRTITTAS